MRKKRWNRWPRAAVCLGVVVSLLAAWPGGAESAAETAAAPTPREILDPWTGTWAGEFKVYTQDGRLTTLLSVRQTYRWDGDIQRARFEEIDQDGNVVTAEAKNYWDDQGRLICEVVKSTGDTSQHFGRYSDGYLFWYGSKPGRIETFRERVEVDPDGQRTYTITGFGAYGRGDNQKHFLFEGKYAEVQP
ncbi:MAG: hypothetical protein AAGG38_00070 [Planctomycetota bacterium]